MSTYSFYGQDKHNPLSAAHTRSGWEQSVIGQLNRESNGNVFIREMPKYYRKQPTHVWRVIDAYYSQEDSTVTYFRALDSFGDQLPFATFGVTYDGVDSRIGGGFMFEPRHGNNYYVPVENKFMTPNTGGYTVEVLDLFNPTEGLAFGMKVNGKKHECLVVTFQLFEIGENYPNEPEWF